MRKIIFVCCILGLLMPLSLLANDDLRQKRDSLEILLQAHGQKHDARRMELLNHLCDLDMALGDTTYIMPCWQEAELQKDLLSMDDLIIPLAMRSIKRKQVDSIKVWFERCDKLPYGWRQCNRQYIEMMSDIQNFNNYDELVNKLREQQMKIDAKHRPYEAMRILFSMGILVNFKVGRNEHFSLKKGNDYLKEALAIARKLPFRQAAHFTRQLLLSLSSSDVKYCKEYLEFIEKFMNEDDMQRRPFYSRRALISALDKLITQGSKLSREDLDGYYAQLCNLVKEYPYDLQVPAFFFVPRMHYRYFICTEQNEQALFWCDSLISVAPRMGHNMVYYAEDRMKLLAKLDRWEDAYNQSLSYISLLDSTQAENSKKKIEELQTQYNVDNLMREKTARRMQLFWAILCSVLLALGLFIYVVYSKRVRNKNRILILQLKQSVEVLKKEISSSSETYSPIYTIKQNQEQEQVQEQVQDQTSMAPQQLYKHIMKVMTEEKLYLQPNLNRAVLLEKLGVNKNKLAEAFGSENILLNDCIRLLRLQESLLIMDKEPDLPLNIVAERSGFGSYISFYRAFYKQYAVKPTEYCKVANA